VATPHLVRTEAVVLRRHDLGETDRILTLYTARSGKLRAVAKGIRRPTSHLGGHLELFTHVRVMLAAGRNLDVVTQVETVESYLGLREDLVRASYAYYAAELVDRLTPDHAESVALFDLLVAGLQRIATGRRPVHALHQFALRALTVLGFRPELQVCVRCRTPLTPVENALSLGLGGVLCPDCLSADPAARGLSANALKVLRLYQEGDWATIDRLRLDPALTEEVEQAIKGYVQFVAETQLKSAGFVATLRREGLTGAS
jgi:DNA repair protein RecO (recombination protein O)